MAICTPAFGETWPVLVRLYKPDGSVYFVDSRLPNDLIGCFRKLKHDRQGQPYVSLWGTKRRVVIVP